MPAPPARASRFPVGSLDPAVAKVLDAEWFDYCVALLGATGNAADARTALGAAADSAVIKTTGDQAKSGVLTFSASPVLPGNATTALQAVPKQQLDAAVAPATLVPALSVYLGEVATTSGTSHQLLGVPSWALRVEIDLLGVSVNGSDVFGFQVGNSGGFAVSGYIGSVSGGSNPLVFSGGFTGMQSNAPAGVWEGHVVLRRARSADTSWSYTATLGRSDTGAVVHVGAGRISISDLDRVRIAMLSGLSTFDAGAIRARAGV
jgi:hypothetical protein